MKNHLSTTHLLNMPLFRHMEDEAMREILEVAQTKHYEQDQFVFFEGDPAERFYLVIEGRVRLTQVTADGHQVIMGYINPGGAFAVIAVLSNIPLPVTAQVVEPLVVLVWDNEPMEDLMRKYPQLSLNAMKILARHIQDFQTLFRELSTEKVERRIARTLLRLANQMGRKTDEGVFIDMKLTRQDLAEMTGTNLYTVSRTLSKWEKAGSLLCGREQVTILKPHMLVSIAEEIS